MRINHLKTSDIQGINIYETPKGLHFGVLIIYPNCPEFIQIENYKLKLPLDSFGQRQVNVFTEECLEIV